MRLGSLIILVLALIAGLWFFGIVNFSVRDSGELPEVTVEGGRAPDVDVTVNPPEVEVTTEERTVTVPKVDVKTPKEKREEAAGAPEENTN